MLNIFAKTFMTATGTTGAGPRDARDRPRPRAENHWRAYNRFDEMGRARTFPHDPERRR